jgi:hypothetical protein
MILSIRVESEADEITLIQTVYSAKFSSLSPSAAAAVADVAVK